MSRLTGFSPLVRKQIKDRAGADGSGLHRCEVCGNWVFTHHLHHRIPRGSGGTRRPEVNQAANGLLVCPSDHEKIELFRATAVELGQLISQHRKILPSEVPVLRRGVWVLLDNHGDYIAIPEPAGGRVA